MPRFVAHEVDRLAQDRQVRQAEEVELQQAERLDGVHLVLGHERVRVRRLLERHELGQRLAVMTTPAAWVEALRATPSSCRAKSMIRLTAGSASTCSRRAG